MNWYKQSQKAIEPNPQDIVDDFLNGINVAPFDPSELGTETEKTARRKRPVLSDHYRHTKFFDAFALLPPRMKDASRIAFHKMMVDPKLVGLKKHNEYGIYSASIGNGYRALAIKVGKYYIWYWIGTHEEYNSKKSNFPPKAFDPDPNHQNPEKPKTPKKKVDLLNPPNKPNVIPNMPKPPIDTPSKQVS